MKISVLCSFASSQCTGFLIVFLPDQPSWCIFSGGGHKQCGACYYHPRCASDEIEQADEEGDEEGEIRKEESEVVEKPCDTIDKEQT